MKDGKVYRSHKSSGAKRPYTPAAPTKAPTNPTRSAGVVPEGTEGSTPPLNETKEVEDASEPSVNDPPRPPPVKFAPLGPIGRELSVNAHSEELQMHLFPMGSQNGVEQFDGNLYRGDPLEEA